MFGIFVFTTRVFTFQEIHGDTNTNISNPSDDNAQIESHMVDFTMGLGADVNDGFDEEIISLSDSPVNFDEMLAKYLL